MSLAYFDARQLQFKEYCQIQAKQRARPMGGAAVYREKVKTAFPTVLAAKGESLPVP
jgi:hypothetical protein